MKKCIAILLALFLVASVVFADDVELVAKDPKVMSIRQMYATATSGAISESLSISTMGTNYIELVSIRLHLNAAGGGGDFTVVQNSALGATYDTVLLTQDMTSVVDLFQTYLPGEAIFDNNDILEIDWANANARTYGIEILYRQR